MVEFVNQIKLYPHRFFKTCALYTAFIGIGFSLGVVGPTLLDLKSQVGRGLNEVATALPARAGGYALGSFVMGFLYDRLNFMLTASICMAITTVLTASMPHIYELYSLLTVFFLNGGFLGFFEAGANMQLLHLWGKENPPFMQALHLCYGVGALIVPLVAEPFLIQSDLDDDNDDKLLLVRDTIPGNSSHALFGDNETSSFITTIPSLIHEGEDKYVDPVDLQLVYPYSVVAGILAFNSIYFFFLWKFYPNTEEHPSRKQPSSSMQLSSMNNVRSVQGDDNNDGDKKRNPLAITSSSSSSNIKKAVDKNICLAVVPYKEQSDNNYHHGQQQQPQCISLTSSFATPDVVTTNCRERICREEEETLRMKEEVKKQYKRYKGMVIILTVMFMHIYYGLEITFGSFLTTFAVESDLKLKKSDGAHMTSLFWGTFTFLRLFTVFYIEYVGAEMNILISLMGVLIANVLLVPFGNSSELCLWLGVGVIGMGTSSIWASLFGYLEEYFTVTSRIASGMIVSAIVGEFVFPLIISNFVADTPQVFLWVTLFCSIAMTLIFILMIFVMRYKVRGLNQALGLTPSPTNGEATHH